MSSENTHKFMGFYKEILIPGVDFSTWFLLLYAVSYRVYSLTKQKPRTKVEHLVINPPYKFLWAYGKTTYVVSLGVKELNWLYGNWFPSSAVPVSPPGPRDSPENLLGILADCQATCVLTNDQLIEETRPSVMEELRQRGGVPWYSTTTILANEAHGSPQTGRGMYGIYVMSFLKPSKMVSISKQQQIRCCLGGPRCVTSIVLSPLRVEGLTSLPLKAYAYALDQMQVLQNLKVQSLMRYRTSFNEFI